MTRFLNKFSPEYKIMQYHGLSLFDATQIVMAMEEAGFDFEVFDDKAMLKEAGEWIDAWNANGEWREEGVPEHEYY